MVSGMNKFYTEEEKAVFKKYEKLYEANPEQWDYESACRAIEGELEGRTYNGIRTAWFKFRRNGYENMSRRKRVSNRGKIRRGSRMYTPEGLKSAQEAGRNRIVSMKDRLRQLGLTDDQISYALSAKSARLSKDQVTMIEDWVTRHKTVSIEFKIAENNKSKISIKWASGSTATILNCREGQEQVASVA